MPNETGLLVICSTLVIILLLLFVFGIVAYKIYLKNNLQQLNDVIKKYESLIDEHLQAMKSYEMLTKEGTKYMLCFIEHLEDFKRHPIYKDYKNDNTRS